MGRGVKKRNCSWVGGDLEDVTTLAPSSDKDLNRIQVRLMQLSIFAITIPPCASPGICTENLPPLWGFCILIFVLGAGILLGYVPRGGHLSINDFCHFWNFHYNRKNWRQTTLRGYLLLRNLYVFKEVIQTLNIMSKVIV